MFNYESIDKTPTVIQIKAIIEYIENDTKVEYNFTNMMDMRRIKPNKILLDLNNANFGDTFEITFNEQNEIVNFKNTGSWMS